MISEEDKRLFKDDLELVMCKFSIKFPFWGILSERCKYSLTENFIETACIDKFGHCIFNVNFINELRKEDNYYKKLVFLVSHEISHFAFEHLLRIDSRDPILWNIACDYAINLILSYQFEDKNYLIKGALLDEKYADKTADQIYNMLFENATKIKLKIPDMNFKGTNDGDNDNDGDGGYGSDDIETVRGRRVPLPDQDGKSKDQIDNEMKDHIKVAFSEAYTVAKNQGKLPSNFERAIYKLLKPKVNWLRALKNKLRHGLSRTEKRDVTWNIPNRRFLDRNYILPSNIGPESPKICYAVDTSGSMCQNELTQAMTELEDIRKKFNAKVYVLDCDAEVHSSRWINPQEPLPVLNGGGGTDFTPVFDHIINKRIKPDYVIFFTDGYGDFGQDKKLPVLWIMTSDVTPPFGDTIRVNSYYDGAATN